MLKPKVAKKLNEQINAEIYSAYLYLSMSAYFLSINLPGAATWMRIQGQEELTHAMKIYDYIDERSGIIKLTPIAAPPIKWESPLAVFEEAYKHEQKVSALIDALADLAVKESDHASLAMLQWFINEQVEEEAAADAVVQKLRLVGNDGGGLFLIDNELGTRVFTPIAATT